MLSSPTPTCLSPPTITTRGVCVAAARAPLEAQAGVTELTESPGTKPGLFIAFENSRGAVGEDGV